MPTRTSPEPPRYDASVQRSVASVKNVHDREPLLIPQLFEDTLPPWYRRRSGLTLAALIAVCTGCALAVLVRYGVGGTAERVGRVGTAMLRMFARMFGG
jgi:hypothetical protein